MAVVVLNNQSEEIVEDVLREILTSQFEEDLHGADIPVVRGRKSLR